MWALLGLFPRPGTCHLLCPIYMMHPFCFHSHSCRTSPAMRSRLPDPMCPAFPAPTSHLTGPTSACLPGSCIPPTMRVLPPLPYSCSLLPRTTCPASPFCAPLLAGSCASCTFFVSLKICWKFSTKLSTPSYKLWVSKVCCFSGEQGRTNHQVQKVLIWFISHLRVMHQIKHLFGSDWSKQVHVSLSWVFFLTCFLIYLRTCTIYWFFSIFFNLGKCGDMKTRRRSNNVVILNSLCK